MLKEPLNFGILLQNRHTNRPRTVSQNCHTIVVSAELVDIRVDPNQSGPNVLDAPIPRIVGTAETEQPLTVVHGYDYQILIDEIIGTGGCQGRVRFQKEVSRDINENRFQIAGARSLENISNNYSGREVLSLTSG